MVVKGGALSLANKKPLYMQSRRISQMLSIAMYIVNVLPKTGH